MNYLITPYNNNKIVQKCMNFERSEEVVNLLDSCNDKESRIWRRISGLILGDKHSLRKFLCSVNHDKYAEITQASKKEVKPIKVPRLGHKYLGLRSSK